MRKNIDIVVEAAHYIGDAKVGSADGVTLTYGGARLDSFAPLYADAGVPGVLFRPLVADEGGNVDTGLNAAFLAQLDSLWAHRLAASGFFTAQQVTVARGLIAHGVFVVPASAATIKNIDPAHPLGMFTPGGLDAPGRRDQWDATVSACRDMVTLYLKGEQADARAKGAELEANTAFWDSVVAVANDPLGTVAGWGSQQVLHALLGLVTNPYVLGLGAIVVVGVVISRGGGAKLVKLAAGK